LNNLADKPAVDLKPPFQSFNSALEGLAAAAKGGEVTGNHLVRSNATFLAAWGKQLTAITNADVRSRSETRRKEVSDQFNTAQGDYAKAQDALRSLIDYLQDIRRALSTDLTTNGLESVKPLVGNANTTATKVQTALTQASASLSTLSAQMSSANGPTAR
jgi:hypothetical protein